MKEGLRSGKTKVEKDEGSLEQHETVAKNNGQLKQGCDELDGGKECGEDERSESQNVGEDDVVVEKNNKKVNGEVPIGGRVLRSWVAGNGGGDKVESVHEGVGEIGKKRRLVVENGKGQSSGRVLRSGTVVNCAGVKVESDGGEIENVGVTEKRKTRRLVENREINVVDSKVPIAAAGRVLRSRTVFNYECVKVEGNVDKAESDDDKVDTDGNKVDTVGDKVDTDGNKVDTGGDNADTDGDKAESNAIEAETDGNKVGTDGDKVETDGDKAESNAIEAETNDVKADSNCDKEESGTDKIESDCNKVENDDAKVETDNTKADSDDDMAVSENVAAAEIRKKNRVVRNGGKNDAGGVDNREVKETEACGKAPVAGRVLRSRTVVNAGNDKAENDRGLVGGSRLKDGSDKKFSKAENEGGDRLVTGFTTKLKGKRGRPPKLKNEESQRSDGELKKLKGMRGRPRQAKKEESDLLDGPLRKKLRSDQDSCKLLKTDLDKEGNMFFKSKSRFKSQEREKANTATNNSFPERKMIGKDAPSTSKRDKKGKDLESEDEEGLKEQKQKQDRNKIGKNESKDGRRELKQAVSEKIVKMILAAGWTIERRQRNGRAYMDAVYVCPAGKTHWSVTKAYSAFMNENGNCKNGVKLTPIPPEELSILRRVVVKKRSGKKVKNGNMSNADIEEKRKRKLSKSRKGKHLLTEQDASCEGDLSLVQRHKRQKTQNRKRCALLVRNSENVDSESDGFIPYDGKRTVLSWMIDLGTLSPNSKLKYMNKRKRKVLLEGTIADEGIHCGCCNEVISLSEFVTHTKSDYSEPLRHILIDSGSSLLQCLLNSWNKQEESKRRGFHHVEVTKEDPNDDTCGICGDGGNLICCDGCPSTFHQSCLEIKKFPSGDWRCVYCSCKFCGMFSANTCQGDGDEDIAASALLSCHLCEERYHQCCVQALNAVTDDPNSPSFCTTNCQELFEKLEMLFGVRHELEEGFSLTLLRRSDVGDTKVDCNTKLIECNAKLAVAFLVMDECFLPMVDQRSGVNLIHNILYNRGSNFNRLNYGGFFTAILERGDEITCAATIRIHGNYLAEMPFIGTRYMYRRQGMCRRLLTAIESALCSLKVERLVIPAISELTETWTSVFGFNSLEDSSKQMMKNMNILVFPGVEILQKPLLNQLSVANRIPEKGLRSTDLEHHRTDDEHLIGSNEATAPCDVSRDKLAAVQSEAQLPCDVSLDNLGNKNNLISIPPGSISDVHIKTGEINEDQNSASIPHGKAVELGTKQNQPEVLCNVAEGHLAGSDAEATASCTREAVDELPAVESDAQLSNVTHDTLEGGNNSVTIPAVSISDVNKQTEQANEHPILSSIPDEEVDLGTKHDMHSRSEVDSESLPHSECIDSATDIPCALVKSTEEANAHPSLASIRNGGVDLGTKHDLHSRSEVESQSLPHSECTDSATDITCALMKSTEEANAHPSLASIRDGEVDLGTKHDLYSRSEVESQSLPHSVESHSLPHSESSDSVTEAPSVLVKSTKNIDCKVTIEHDIIKPMGAHDEGFLCLSTCNDSATELEKGAFEAKVSDENIAHNETETTIQISHKHHDSQLLQVEGSVFCPSGKMLETSDVENNSYSVQHLSTVTEEVDQESINFSDSEVVTKINITCDEIHQAAPLAQEKAIDCKGHSTTMLFGCSNDCQNNGHEIHNVASFPADNSSHPTCEDSIRSNGNSKGPDVPEVDLTSNDALVNINSLQQSTYDSGADNTSFRQPNSSSTCASGGGNSFGAPEVTILSNQGQAT